MLRCSLLRRRVVASTATAAFPTEYVPKPIAGQQWAAPAGVGGKPQQAQQADELTERIAPALAAKLGSIRRQRGNAASAVAEGTSAFRATEAAVAHYETKVLPNAGYFSVPAVDYSLHAGVSPVLSPTMAQLLLDVHHAGVVDRLNKMTFGTQFEGHGLDSVIFATAFDAENAAIHTAACEHWNHSFAWKSMLPFGSAPSARLRAALTTSTIKQHSVPVPWLDVRGDGAHERELALAAVFGIDRVKRMLSDACRDCAASGGGWVFLVSSQAGQKFEVIRYRPGTSPITAQLVPLVAINMQYHARFADYSDDSSVQNYIDNALRAVNWRLAEQNWAKDLNSANAE